MKTKNNLTTGILIGIGVIVIPLIIMSAKPIPSSNYTSPESHVWEVKMSIAGGTASSNILYNKSSYDILYYIYIPGV